MFGVGREHRSGWHGRRRTGGAVPPDPGRTEELIAVVEQRLGITAEQREAWERLTEVVRDSTEAMRIARAAVHESERRTLARFDRFADLADVVSASFRRLRPVLQGLYRTLDDAQLQALDELITRGPAQRFGAGI